MFKKRRLAAVLAIVALVFGSVAVASPSQAISPGDIMSPFDAGQATCIMRGYSHLSHKIGSTSEYGLDLVAGNCNSTSAAGLNVRTPFAGTVSYWEAAHGNLCINIAGNRSVSFTHINASVTSGPVTLGQSVGTVAAAQPDVSVAPKNNNVAHLHFQIWNAKGCYNGSVMPFDSAHGTRICGAPNLTPTTAGTFTNGVWSGTTFTSDDCSGSSSGGSTGNRISLLDAANTVWAKDSLGYGGWSQQTSVNGAKSIAVGGSRQVLIDSCDAVWSKDDLANGGWTQEAGCGSANKVRVSSTGLRVILDFCGAVYAKVGAISNGGWTQEAGCGSAKDVQIGGNVQVILDNCESIWSKDSVSSAGWTQEAGCGAGRAITVDSNGTRIITNYCSALWAKSGAISNGGWTQETACDSATTVEAGGGVQVLIDLCGAVYAKNNGVSFGGWTKEADCDSAKAIDVGSSGRQVVLSLDNAIWAKDSVGTGGWGQQTLPNSADLVAVG